MKGRVIMIYKLPLLLVPQPEGGFTVTSPILPELITEGDTLDEALHNVRDALDAVIEIYAEDGRPLPASVIQDQPDGPIWFENMVASP